MVVSWHFELSKIILNWPKNQLSIKVYRLRFPNLGFVRNILTFYGSLPDLNLQNEVRLIRNLRHNGVKAFLQIFTPNNNFTNQYYMVTIIFEKQTVKSLFETIKAVFERIWLHCAKRRCSVNVDCPPKFRSACFGINMQTFTLFKCKLSVMLYLAP